MGVRTLVMLLALGAGFFALYLGTRGQWNWPRLMRRGLATIAVLVVVTGGWIWWSALPPSTPVTELWDIPLGASDSDVRFLKGDPAVVVEGQTWIYVVDRSRTYYLNFADNGEGARVTRIEVAPGPGYSSGMSLFGVHEGFDAARLGERMGAPSEIVPLSNGLRRAYLYRHLNAVFVLERGRVVSFGIYDVDAGDPYVEDPESAGTAARR